MFSFTDANGNTHPLNSQREMLKALGTTPTEVIITDEDGQIMGAGYGIDGALGSQPIFKALKNGGPLIKAEAQEQRFILKKSVSKPQNKIDSLIEDLTILKKSMGASAIKPTPIENTDDRLARIEADIRALAAYITNK